MGVVMLASLYLVRVILNVLGVVDYGIYNVVCGFVFILNVLNLTLSNGIQRYYNDAIGRKNKEDITKIFNASLRIQFFVVLLVLFLVETIGIWVIESKMIINLDRMIATRWVFQFSALSLVAIIMQAPYTSAILAHERMDYYAFLSIIDVSLKLGVAFLVQVIVFDKLIVYGGLMLFVSIINFLLSVGYCKLQLKEIKYTKYLDKGYLNKMISFSGWQIMEPIAYTLRGHGSNMVLNLFFGTIINAAYGISYQVASYLDQFCSGIGTAFKPQLIQSYVANDYTRTNSLLYSMSKFIFALKLMLCVPIIIETDVLLKFWMGDGFPYYAVSFTSLSVIVRLIDSLILPITTVIYATEDIKKYMVITSLCMICTLPASYLLFKIGYPPIYLFVSMIIVTLLTQYICVVLLNKQCSFFNKTDYLRRVVLPCFCLCVIVYSITLGLSFFVRNEILRIVVVCISSIFVTVLSSYFIIFDKKEKQYVNSYINKYFHKL